jgi:hypothetical protein
MSYNVLPAYAPFFLQKFVIHGTYRGYLRSRGHCV